ncbi:MAG: hypothetical protein WBA87_02175 [Microbacterium sp.]
MTDHNSPPKPNEDYTTSEGLRALLHRLHHAGAHAWAHDPVAADLAAFSAQKYAALARKHGLDPWEAASAAFEVMRTRSAREADDPWAVVTRGVQVTCIAEERGQGLLCSTHQARRPQVSVFHDPERFADRETPLSDYHPAFHVEDRYTIAADSEASDVAQQVDMAERAIELSIVLFTTLGWPEDTIRPAIEHVCAAVERIGSRQSAHELLRRDKHARALLDLPADSWSALLHVLLGNPHPAYQSTSSGRGILFRLLLGETLPALLSDNDLVMTIAMSLPTHGGRR